MKKSEKVLLSLFVGLVLAFVLGGGGMLAVRNYLEVREEVDLLRDRLSDMNLAIAEGSDWAAKQEWLDENTPLFTSSQEASARLLETITREAEKLSLDIGGKEFLEQARQIDSDGEFIEEEGSFDKATVKTTLNGVSEKLFFAWLHALQQPKSFIGVTRLQIVPSGTNKTINAEVEFTQFFHQKRQPRVTKAN